MSRLKWVLAMAFLMALAGCIRVAPDPCAGIDPPVAAFRVTPDSGELPVLVRLDASDAFAREGDLVAYSWDFGDGTVGEGRVVERVFSRDPAGPEEQTFRVTLTVTQAAVTGRGACVLTAQTVQTLSYGVSRPLNVVSWQAKATYYGTMIEGTVRNVSSDLRITHGRVVARLFREPDRVVVMTVERELWDIRPGEERLFMIPVYLWPWQFDWVELRTEAFTAQP